MPDQPDARLALSPTQQELFKALTDKCAEISVCYQAAVAVINDDVLPDRIALAAHALRELMEKLPNDGTAIDRAADINERVNALRTPWDEAVAEEGARGGEPWGNGIGAALRSFLSAVSEFFRGRDGISAGRRQQAMDFLNRLEVAAVPLPEDLQRKNAGEWMHLRAYFNDVSHHRSQTSDAEFREQVTQLEAFLYARLIPKPTADFAAIDALLQED